MREAGLQLAKDFDEVDFGLEDSFCDSTELKESWERTKTPDSWLTLCAAFCNYPKYKLFKSKAQEFTDMMNDEGYDNDSDDDVNGEENEDSEKEETYQQEEHIEDEEYNTWVRDKMSIRIHCMFQIMYYLRTKGRKKYQCI